MTVAEYTALNDELIESDRVNGEESIESDDIVEAMYAMWRRLTPTEQQAIRDDFKARREAEVTCEP